MIDEFELLQLTKYIDRFDFTKKDIKLESEIFFIAMATKLMLNN